MSVTSEPTVLLADADARLLTDALAPEVSNGSFDDDPQALDAYRALSRQRDADTVTVSLERALTLLDALSYRRWANAQIALAGAVERLVETIAAAQRAWAATAHGRADCAGLSAAAGTIPR